MTLFEELKERILILDGAMGTMLQKGMTERQILQAYVEAGADIITTNSFSAIRTTQADFGKEDQAAEMALNAARTACGIARSATRKIYVAGSVSPTGKSLTLPSDAGDPTLRALDFDTLSSAYKEQIKALAEGGVDIILLETCYDALNAKAAIRAIGELGTGLPVIISATVSDRSGRTLTGQTLEAFYTSVKHCPGLAAFGINCALGAKEMYSIVKEIASFSSHPVIFYPNAGIPDEFGRYKDSPQAMAKVMEQLAAEGLVNIVGGCCGTTDEHIRQIRDAVAGMSPRRLPEHQPGKEAACSGLEAVRIDPERNFTNIGERTNVAGSRKFARLIEEENFVEAIAIAAAQIEGGADIIDINMDDPMLDSTSAMRKFLRHIASEPAVAKAAIMIDSSRWDTIAEGLKNTQGKSIVNSISLKEGEEEFLRKAGIIRDFGAAMVVMAFDEEGQAVTFDRKTAICERSYRLLTQKAGVAPEDIIFDCNILSIGTGIPEHARFGVDFIEAVRWVKNNLPGARTSGGVSNLSFAFRGNNTVREAMHSVFLYHAIKAGLDMAIVNPQMLQIYDEIDPDLRSCVEDVIFDKDPEATSKLVELAAGIKETAAQSGTDRTSATSDDSQEADCTEKLSKLLIKGSLTGLEECTLECLKKLGSAVAVIEGPLMTGMEKVGEMFADGRMFLPQVVKSAGTMRDAVSILQPYMGESSLKSGRPRFLIATVQGDVHDIGKNITSIVLQCGGFAVTDLGVMVPAEDILDKALEIGADIIGVSGLITPSLNRMEELCSLMATRGMDIPLFVGGAATSAIHTAVKLAPLYPHVFYGADASATAVMAKKIVSDRPGFEDDEKAAQEKLRNLHTQRKTVPARPEQASTANRPTASGFAPDGLFNDIPLQDIAAEELMPYFDWRMFFAVCGVKGKNETLKNEAVEWLESEKPEVRICARFFRCHKEGDVVTGDGISLPMLRNGFSIADFFPENGSAPLGIFAASASGNDGGSLVAHATLVTLTEAASSKMNHDFSNLLPQGMKLIMPGIGYACCPDHSLKRDVLALLPDSLGIKLTESCAMIPEASICGLVIAHRDAAYRDIRNVSPDALASYAALRGFSQKESDLFLGHLKKN